MFNVKDDKLHHLTDVPSVVSEANHIRAKCVRTDREQQYFSKRKHKPQTIKSTEVASNRKEPNSCSVQARQNICFLSHGFHFPEDTLHCMPLICSTVKPFIVNYFPFFMKNHCARCCLPRPDKTPYPTKGQCKTALP